MKTFLGLFSSAFFLIALQTNAGEAVFSADGAKVYFLSAEDKPGVEELDIASGKVVQRFLEKELGGEAVVSLGRDGNGAILLVTPHALHAWSPENGRLKKLASASAGTKFDDVAHDLKHHWTLLTFLRDKPGENEGVFGLALLRDGESKTSEVFCRRVRFLEGPVFDRDGNLYFGTSGDLWHGEIIWDKEMEPARGILNAYRFCPIATLETTGATPAQCGARTVAWAGGHIYAHVKRLGGSGWGDIVRLKTPARKLDGDGELDLAMELGKRAKVYTESLSSVESLMENGGWSHLCGSADGRLVHFTTAGEQGRVHWLVRDGGKPMVVGK